MIFSREQLEAIEDKFLAPYGSHSKYSRGRQHHEDEGVESNPQPGLIHVRQAPLRRAVCRTRRQLARSCRKKKARPSQRGFRHSCEGLACSSGTQPNRARAAQS